MVKGISILVTTLSIMIASQGIILANAPHDILLNVMGKYIDVLHRTVEGSFKPDPNHYLKKIKLYQNGTLIETFTFTEQRRTISQRLVYDFPKTHKGDKLKVVATCNKGQSFTKEFIADYGRAKDAPQKKEEKGESAAVPASWNGDYALENKPKVKALTIRGGKIYTVAGSSVIETFPGTSKLKTTTTCTASECKQTAGSTVEVRFTRDPGGKITYVISGSASTYVKMK